MYVINEQKVSHLMGSFTDQIDVHDISDPQGIKKNYNLRCIVANMYNIILINH